jgi:hypothetical protein
MDAKFLEGREGIGLKSGEGDVCRLRDFGCGAVFFVLEDEFFDSLGVYVITLPIRCSWYITEYLGN